MPSPGTLGKRPGGLAPNQLSRRRAEGPTRRDLADRGPCSHKPINGAPGTKTPGQGLSKPAATHFLESVKGHTERREPEARLRIRGLSAQNTGDWHSLSGDLATRAAGTQRPEHRGLAFPFRGLGDPHSGDSAPGSGDLRPRYRGPRLPLTGDRNAHTGDPVARHTGDQASRKPGTVPLALLSTSSQRRNNHVYGRRPGRQRESRPGSSNAYRSLRSS